MSADYLSGFTVGEPAWHQLDNNVDAYPANWEDALVLAGIPWDIDTDQAYRNVQMDPRFQPKFEPVADRQFIVRDDTREILSGDTVGSSYHAIPLRGPDGMGNIIETIFDVASDETQWPLKMETLSALKGGQVIVAVIRLDEPWHVEGDSSARYDFFVIRNSFDRTTAFTVGPNSVRVLCANTDLAAQMMWKRTGLGISLKHTSGFKDRVKDIKRAVQAALRSQEQTRAFLDELARQPIINDEFEAFLDVVFPLQGAPGQKVSEQTVRNTLNRRAQVRAIRDSDTVAGAGIAGNLYGAVMAVTEWADHKRPAHTLDTRVERILYHGDEFKTRAFAAARKMVST